MSKIRGRVEKWPRVLVVSNNPFSHTLNNGKTLASFFADAPVHRISQLYFSTETPAVDLASAYYSITESDILRAGLSGRRPITSDVTSEPRLHPGPLLVRLARRSEMARLLREVFWLGSGWKSSNLIQWLDDISPEVIFLCGGDSAFAYRLAHWIQKRFRARLVLYVTDDYILPRRRISPFWWVRRYVIARKLRQAALSADIFLTISDEMREAYRTLLGRDSQILLNRTPSIREVTAAARHRSTIDLVYAGGLHSQRYRTLRLLADALDRFNSQSTTGMNARLLVYSPSDPPSSVKRMLNDPRSCHYCGSLDAAGYHAVLNDCDIPVHVESFSRRAIEVTRLSISTKIPEYLSLAKPILAVGPSSVASMRYLRDVAWCITSEKEIDQHVAILMNNASLRSELSEKAVLLFNRHQANRFSLGDLLGSVG